jgi:quinol monooxygenase YgiN
MYGSVAKMRPKPGKAQELRDYMVNVQRRAPGMVAAYFLTEDSGGNVWVMGIFEDEKLYRANAADPEQGKVYEGFRALLEEDPEWHDGAIAQRPV